MSDSTTTQQTFPGMNELPPSVDPVRHRKALGGDGILTREDLAEFNRATLRVLSIMRDGEWHSSQEIRLAAGNWEREASEGLRRMRELRPMGWTVEKRRVRGTGKFEYRLKGGE